MITFVGDTTTPARSPRPENAPTSAFESLVGPADGSLVAIARQQPYTPEQRAERARTAVREWAAEIGYRKASDEDLFANWGWHQAATDLLAVSDSTFDFVVEAKATLYALGRISVGTARGVINCEIAAARRERDEAQAATRPAQDTDAAIAAKVASGQKFDFTEVTPALVAVAERWLAAYQGNFAFLLDVKRSTRGGRLSVGQAKGVLNCLLADIRRNPAPVAAQDAASASTVADLPGGSQVAVSGSREVRDGYYTITLEDGSHVTLRVKTAKSGKYQGVGLLIGSQNTSDYLGIGSLNGTRFSFWRDVDATQHVRTRQALAVLLESDDEARLAAGKAFAQESGCCYVCNRLLTTPESIASGIGPVCREG